MHKLEVEFAATPGMEGSEESQFPYVAFFNNMTS